MQGILGSENIVIRSDMNGHMIKNRKDYDRMIGEGHAFGERVLDFASACKLTIVHIFFRNREEHYTMYESAVNKSKNRFFFMRRGSLKQCKN